MLTVGGTPQLVRAIDHCGEPFAWLKSLGFNTVRLATAVTPEQFREAEECGIWLIAPPPGSHTVEQYGSSLNQVVAWDLGAGLTELDLDLARQRAQQLKSVPDESKCAVLCQPREAVWEYSRIADMTVLQPPGPHSALPLARYGQWYLSRSRLLRLNSHFWAAIHTQFSPALMQQISLMGTPRSVPLSLEPDQIRLMTYHAIASGARGLLFCSASRLDDNDRMTQLRAQTLRRINQELALVEPWATTGQYDGDLSSAGSVARISVLRTQRSRLVIVIRQAEDQQYVAGPVPPQPVAFDLTNIPDTDDVYEVGEDGFRRITPQRKLGLQVTLDKPSLISTIVTTQDPLVVNFLASHAAHLRRYQDQLVGDIAAQMYAHVVETQQRLLQGIPPGGLGQLPTESEALEQARGELQQYQQLLEGGGHERAFEFLQRGRQQLARAVRTVAGRHAVLLRPAVQPPVRQLLHTA